MGQDHEQRIAKAVVEGDWEIICPEMQLLSCPGYHTSMFDGSGVIRSRKGGHLSFEIIGRYLTGFPPLMRQEQGVHGQIPDVDQHVMLRAVAADGREWRSNWITPKAYPASTKTCTWRVASGIESLLCSETRRQSDSSEGRLYIDSPRLSFDAKTHTVMKAGDDVLLEQWSIDRHEGHLGLAAVSYRQTDHRWLVVRAKQDTPIMPNWAGLVCQALSFSLACTVRPVVAVREFNNRIDTCLFSGPFSCHSSYLTRPVPPDDPASFWLCVKRFFEWFSDADTALAEMVFDELEGVRGGSMGSIRTAALTIAAAVEALSDVLLKNSGSGREKLTGLDSLVKHIETWEGNDDLRSRALSAVRSFQKVRTVDRLYQFARERSIPDERISSWKKLRDVAAHGKAPSSRQELVDRYYSTVELLYRLIAASIEYDGSICDTATYGWGLDEWGFRSTGRDHGA